MQTCSLACIPPITTAIINIDINSVFIIIIITIIIIVSTILASLSSPSKLLLQQTRLTCKHGVSGTL